MRYHTTYTGIREKIRFGSTLLYRSALPTSDPEDSTGERKRKGLQCGVRDLSHEFGATLHKGKTQTGTESN